MQSLHELNIQWLQTGEGDRKGGKEGRGREGGKEGKGGREGGRGREEKGRRK